MKMLLPFRRVAWLAAFAHLAGPAAALAQPAASPPNWARDRVQAWCIVPYDAKKRTPEERAKMLLDLGIRRYAYDWRPEHIPQFDREIEVMKANGIEITAWWFPTTLNENARTILAAIERGGIKPELWVMGTGAPAKSPAEQAARAKEEATRLRPIAEAAAKLGCKIALYNHGGWFGDPENQVDVLAQLRASGVTNVGIVYNFHHGHDHIRNFEKIWPRINGDVIAINFSGLVIDGDRKNQKILYLGEGDEELALMKIVRDSGWKGTIGILSHRTEFDAAETLKRNLDGYDRLVAQLAVEAAKPPLPKKQAKKAGE